MKDYSKGELIISGPEDGDSYWQPLPSTGYITSKITPYNSPYNNFATGIQVIEPGTSIREHGHERSHELLFVYEGTGTAKVDGETYDLAQGSMIMVGRRRFHEVFASDDGQLKIMWVIFPPGLEDWFSAIGRPRNPAEDGAPPVFDRPEDVTEIQDRQRFVRPEDA